MKKIVFLIGSVRKGSFNAMLADMAERALEGRAEVKRFGPRDVPLMDQGIEFPAPAEVAAVRQSVTEADGVWIFSPEYNGQIPGGLKNLLDWLSRPVEFMNYEKGSVMKGKKAAVTSAAGKSAGAHVRAALASLLSAMRMTEVGGEGLGFALTPESFRTGLWEPGEEVFAAVKAQAEQFLSELD